MPESCKVRSVLDSDQYLVKLLTLTSGSRAVLSLNRLNLKIFVVEDDCVDSSKLIKDFKVLSEELGKMDLPLTLRSCEMVVKSRKSFRRGFFYRLWFFFLVITKKIHVVEENEKQIS